MSLQDSHFDSFFTVSIAGKSKNHTSFPTHRVPPQRDFPPTLPMSLLPPPPPLHFFFPLPLPLLSSLAGTVYKCFHFVGLEVYVVRLSAIRKRSMRKAAR